MVLGKPDSQSLFFAACFEPFEEHPPILLHEQKHQTRQVFD